MMVGTFFFTAWFVLSASGTMFGVTFSEFPTKEACEIIRADVLKDPEIFRASPCVPDYE